MKYIMNGRVETVEYYVRTYETIGVASRRK